MKLTLSETIKNFNNPNLKGYLIITPDSWFLYLLITQ